MNAEAGQDDIAIVPPDDQKTLEWIAVLSAAEFDYGLSRADDGWVIHVPPSQSGAAQAEIAAYEADSRNWRPAVPAPIYSWQPPHHTTAALWGVVLLAAFYVWFGPYDAHSPIHRATGADAEAILAGEWWRPITALTLHSGFVHLAGNVAILLFLGHVVCSQFGGGLGWTLMLGAGIAGNVAVAWLVRSGHISYGASTAGFGAIGILVARQTVETFRRWREWRSIP